jgi:hypothetical protein
MANTIRWAPSPDVDILKYDIYSGATSTGSWTFLTDVLHSLSGPDYSSGTFFYNDISGSSSTWYRLDAIDSFAQTGSSYFQATSPVPGVFSGNKIAWEPSLDPAVDQRGTYLIEASRQVSGPWTPIAQISAVRAGSYYNSTVNRFVYGDTVNPYNTWYHIVDVDYNGGMNRPSEPFMTHPMPYFVAGATPYGIFDNDIDFQMDADRNADFVRKKLGEPVIEVHLSSSQIYASFEEACLEYSAMVNSYQAKSVLSTFLGAPTGNLAGAENKYAIRTLALAKTVADPFSAEAGMNSHQPVYSGSVDMIAGQQEYDLPTLLSASGQWNGSGTIVIRELYHKSPMSAYRFFGTTSGLNYLNNQFRFESFTPETLFYMLPVWEDILRGMQFKTSNTVRRSNYSFDLHNNHLRLFPVPQGERKLWFTFSIDPNPADPSGAQGGAPNPAYNGVSNLSNIPFGNIQYSNLNSISKHWIRRMTLAMAKEIEGHIRSKVGNIPIPNGEITLNGPELITDARAEMDTLRAELKEMLEETTYQKLMEKEAQMSENLQNTWKGVPMGIFTG